MDLISREELREEIFRVRKELANLGMNGAEHIIEHYCGRLIDDAPGVEAIPVEWIKKYNANLCHSPYCFEDDDRTDIERMVEDWEKENERV